MSDEDRAAIEAFKSDVIDPSMGALVVLQFTAEWCGPCKQLSPVLDRIAADYADKGVLLRRIDVDSDRLIAAQFRIQSVPTVYALFEGQPVADLTPFRTEGQLAQALDQLLKQLPVAGEAQSFDARVAPLLDEADTLLAAGEAAEAIDRLSPILTEKPLHSPALARMGMALVAAGRTDEAAVLLGAEGVDGADPEISRARAQLDLASRPKVDVAPFEERLAADPNDHDARLALADALAGAGERDAAADQLLDLIARDRDWNGGAARSAFLKLLEAAGIEDPWASAQRRRLSAVLFT